MGQVNRICAMLACYAILQMNSLSLSTKTYFIMIIVVERKYRRPVRSQSTSESFLGGFPIPAVDLMRVPDDSLIPGG